MFSPMPASISAISLNSLSKRYGKLVAVKDLSLEVRQGEVFGFLGLNGAGKTTTIRILLDLLRPTSGSAQVLGHNCQSESRTVRSLAGYLPGEFGFYGDMSGSATLEFLARLCKQKIDSHYRVQLEERLEFPRSDLRRKIREYSTGMKRKLGLIQAFQSDPALLILDEPTEGLDPLMQESFYELLSEAKNRGRTVFMSSHVLSEVERVCDRIAVIRQGEIVVVSEVEEVKKLAARKVRVEFSEDCDFRSRELPAGHEFIDSNLRTWNLRVYGSLGQLVSLLGELPVRDLEVEEPHLEDVLMKYYREDGE